MKRFSAIVVIGLSVCSVATSADDAPAAADTTWTTQVTKGAAPAPVRPQRVEPVRKPRPEPVDYYKKAPTEADLAAAAAAAPVAATGGPVEAPPAPAAEAVAAPAAPSNAQTHEPAKPLEAAEAEAQPKAVQSYCVNITSAATDARYLRQKKELEAAREDLQARIAGLDAKIADYKSWRSKRDEFAGKATESLVGIYASMKSEPAAKQIAELDEETASAVIAKLDARQSGAILSEMEPKKAARLTQIIAGAGRIPGQNAIAASMQTQPAEITAEAATP